MDAVAALVSDWLVLGAAVEAEGSDWLGLAVLGCDWSVCAS